MLKLVIAPALILSGMAMPAIAIAQTTTVTVIAPQEMNEDQARQWQRMERQANRLVERIADDEVRITDEQSEVARAQARLADAQAKLRQEQRELDRAMTTLAERRTELDSVEARMMQSGGKRPALVVNAQ